MPEQRYRLIPARAKSRVSYGTLAELREEAEALAVELGMPVWVFEAPVDGIVRRVLQVPGPKKARVVS